MFGDNQLPHRRWLNLLITDDSPTNFGNHSCDANLWYFNSC